MARLTTMINPADLRTDSAYPLLEIGQMGETSDGRRFRYCKAGAGGVLVGKLYQSTAETTAWQDLDVSAASKGAMTIVLTSATATLNQLAGGYITITNDTTYPGYTYKIAGNTACSTSACTLTLEEPLIQAIVGGTSADVDLIKHPYDYVELWDYSNHDGTPVGVGVYPITASQYGWLQVGGVCGVLVDSGNITVGAPCYASAAVDGCIDATSTYGMVGTAVTGGSSTEYSLVNLLIN